MVVAPESTLAGPVISPTIEVVVRVECPPAERLTRIRPDRAMMPNAILLTSQVLALVTMFGMSTCAAERRIEIPLEQSGGLPVAEVVSALSLIHI